jgi:general secretion pathway protein G
MPNKNDKTQNSTPSPVAIALVGCLLLVGLAKLIAPSILGRSSTGDRGKTRAELWVLCGAIDQSRLDCGRYPTQHEGIRALFEKPAGVNGWRGPYVTPPIPRDKWGFPYHYRTPALNRKTGYEVLSYGADGVPGGIGDNADITSGSDY